MHTSQSTPRTSPVVRHFRWLPAGVLALACAASGCDEENALEVDDQLDPRACVADWDVIADADELCHIDIDKHLLWREAEGWGVETLKDFNGCVPGLHYRKVLLETNKCSWNHQTWQCAREVWFAVTGQWPNTSALNAVYDKDACPTPRLGEGGGDSGGDDPPIYYDPK